MPKGTIEALGVTTLEDISSLILQSHDLEETLDNIVSLVARRMRSDVCSIYLLEDNGSALRLRASKGLSRKAIGKVTLQLGEGLTGLAAEERRVVAIQEPQSHPRYRYFRETGEERFHSFLGIPLLDRKSPLGVIVIQTKAPRQFSAEEISALSTIAFQVASIVINARLLDSIRQKEEETNRFARELEKTRRSLLGKREALPEDGRESALRGTVAYPGVISGPAYILDERLGFVRAEAWARQQVGGNLTGRSDRDAIFLGRALVDNRIEGPRESDVRSGLSRPHIQISRNRCRVIHEDEQQTRWRDRSDLCSSPRSADGKPR